MTQRLIVGFLNTDSSLPALRWAIDVGRTTGMPLIVVHASALPISVRNGPTSAVAQQLGNPPWASVHSIVQGLGAPAGTTTIVESGAAAAVLARRAGPDDSIILGRPRERLWGQRDTQQRLERLTRVPTIRVAHSVPFLGSEDVTSVAVNGTQTGDS